MSLELEKVEINKDSEDMMQNISDMSYIPRVFEHVSVKEEPVNEEPDIDSSYVFEPELHIGHVPVVFNTQEEIEFSVEETKPDIQFSVEEDNPDIKFSVEETKPDIMELDKLSENVQKTVPEKNQHSDYRENSPLPQPTTATTHILSEANEMRVQIPVKTYKRSKPALKRPPSSKFVKEVDSQEEEMCPEKKRKVEDNNANLLVDRNESPFQIEKLKAIERKKTPANQAKVKEMQEILQKFMSKITVYTRLSLNIKKVTQCGTGHMCMFCKSYHVNVQKHFFKAHKNRVEIASLIALPPTSATRVSQLICIQRMGDFQHNSKLYPENSGKIILLKSSRKYLLAFDKNNFVPCPDCAGYVFKPCLKGHHRRCVGKIPNVFKPLQKRNLLRESYAMQMYSMSRRKDSFLFRENFLQKQSGNLGEVAVVDRLIVLLEEHLASLSEVYSTRVKLQIKLMDSFLLSYQNVTQLPTVTMDQLFDPKNVRKVLVAVKTLLSSSNVDFDVNELQTSLYSLIVMTVFIRRGLCLIWGKLNEADKVLKFYYSFAERWEKEIHPIYRTRVASRKVRELFLKNTEHSVIHLASDVMFLKDLLEGLITNLTEKLKIAVRREIVEGLWDDLAEATVCLVCLFNLLDFEAVEGLKVHEYAVRPDWSVDIPDLYKHKMSKILYTMGLSRIIVCTKFRDREVIILLSPVMKRAIDVLILRRQDAGINFWNPYVFAEGSQEDTKKAFDCFDWLCIKEGFLASDIIQSPKKMEYISFVTQIADMNQDELHWLKKFTKTAIGKAVLSSIFSNFYKKPVCEFQAKRSLESRKETSEGETKKNGSEGTIAFQAKKSQQADHQESQEDKSNKTQSKKKTESEANRSKKEENKNTKEDATSTTYCSSQGFPVQEDIGDVSDPVHLKLRHPRRSNDTGFLSYGRDWSHQQKSYVCHFFQTEIKEERIPEKEKCIECLKKKMTLMRHRKWESLRAFVAVQIKRRKMVT